MALNTIIDRHIENADWQFYQPAGKSRDYKEFKKLHPTSRSKVADYDDYCRLILAVADLQEGSDRLRKAQEVEFRLFMLGKNLKLI